MEAMNRLPSRLKRSLVKPYIRAQYWSRMYDEVTVNHISASFPNSEVEQVRDILSIESDIITHVLPRVNSDDIIYDIGADRGLYTCLLGSYLKSGSVFSFEPHPITSRKLEEIVRFNGIESTVFPVGLGDKSRSATIDGYRLVDSAAGDISIENAETLITDHSLPYPDLIKIDVEGMELEVLDGLHHLFEKSPPAKILCEVHPVSSIDSGLSQSEVDTLKDKLEEYGYNLERVGKNKGQTYLWATQAATE